MRPRFHPRLVNDPFGDPALYCDFLHERRAILFDIGDLSPLSSRDLLRVSHVFVSHTHIDHFYGFDRMLRLLLGREKTLYLFGPSGIHAHVDGKLAGYNWNLIHTYEKPLVLQVTEVDPDRLVHRELSSRNGFHPPTRQWESAFDGKLVAEPSLEIRAELLDHGTPCLGFALREHFHVNVMKARLEDLGLSTGPWLQKLKRAVFEDAAAATPITVPGSTGKCASKTLTVGELKRKVLRISRGQSIAYITDIGNTPANKEKIRILAKGVDHLFIEAAFMDRDRETAAAKRHLTAAQAGRLAALAGVGAITVFHFSPRYEGAGEAVSAEAQEAFRRHRRSVSVRGDGIENG